MKVNELLNKQLLLENITLNYNVLDRSDLMDNAGNFYTGEVNVDGNVALQGEGLTKFPVKFGKVDGYFYCDRNKLTSLKGAPQSVGQAFICSDNNLTSLKGAPQKVGSDFHCESNRITSLEGIHKIIKKIDGAFFLHYNPIESGGIGLLLIEGLKGIYSDYFVFNIIKKYLGQGKKGLLLCQEELIENGFEEYAKL